MIDIDAEDYYLILNNGYIMTCLYNDKTILKNIMQINSHSYYQGNTSCCWELKTPSIKNYDKFQLYLEGNKYFSSWITIEEIQKIANEFNFELIQQTNMFDIRDLFCKSNNAYSINEWNSMLYFDCCIFKHI